VSTIYLVRHAKAGSRGEWKGPDRARPLTEKGRRQAKAIAKMLEGLPIEHILTSEYTRCWETVAPLAKKLGVLVEEAPALAEGSRLSEVLDLFNALGEGVSVLCTHGDVIGDVLTHLATSGIDIGDDPRLEKGSIWILERDRDTFTSARYVPPPDGI